MGGIGAYAFLFVQFDRYAWRWAPFRFCHLTEYPNLSGRWQGKIISSFDNRQSDMLAILEIRQTFSKIHLDLYTEKSSSVSILADFAKEPNGQIAVHYEYQNIPNAKAEATMHPHCGTARLVYFKDEKSLSGSYYNASQHGRGHVGSLEFLFKDNNLIGKFGE